MDGKIGGTPALFRSVKEHIDEYQYVEEWGEDARDLAVRARAGLMWGRRLGGTPPAPPFGDIVAKYELLMERAKPKPGRMKSPVAVTAWMRKMDDIKNGRIPYPKPRLLRDATRFQGRPKGPSFQETIEKRNKLKNRTRAERIADLRAALEQQQ
jgi:hypothetical protein